MSLPRAVVTFAFLWSAAGCFKEPAELHQQVERLKREKAVAEASVHRLEAESKAKDESLASVTGLLNEVGDRLENIQHEQHDLVVLTTTPGVEGKTFVKNKDIPQAFARIEGHLAKNKEQISQLEVLVTAKKMEGQGLKEIIERLKKQNGGLESQLKTLRSSIASLSKDVKRLKTEVVKLEAKVTEKEKETDEQGALLAEQAEKLRESEAERWAGFYIVGTRKELRDKGVTTESGGLLRWVRKPQISGHLSELADQFVRIDIRLTQEIPLGPVKGSPELLPARLTTSYAIERRGDGAYLLVLDSSEFWRLRYLVALVKR